MYPQNKEGAIPSNVDNIAHVPFKSSTRYGLTTARVIKITALSAVLWMTVFLYRDVSWDKMKPLNPTERNTKVVCPQAEVLIPHEHGGLWKSVGADLASETFKLKAVDWLAGAVRVPTESYDKMDPVGVDPRWEIFGDFHNYLLGAFPLIHSKLELTKVNSYGLLYVWKGSDDSLKPILLAAHQDVVPVDPTTASEWTHPPYSGFYDGERLWGRGSVDDKSGLIGVMSAVETLIQKGFQPTRSIILTFGFDEEASGIYGAQELSKVLLERFGEDAFALLVDEGAGFAEQYGGIFALPGIAEKGYIDVRVEVTSPGGHSSIPPPHTSIGILSSLLVHYEANPFKVHLSRESPIYKTMQCIAEYAPSLPCDVRKAIKRSAKSDSAFHAVEKILLKEPAYKSLIGTTQAIDLIQGGVKTNALPEQAWAVVNHRISTDSSVGSVMTHDTKLLKHLAQSFNLTYNAFGVRLSDKDAPSHGTLTLSDAWNTALEPAPVTPSDKDAGPYQMLSGTIKAAYNAHRSLEGNDNIAVTPSIMSGNTDTRYYWKLTKHIFRYSHYNAGSMSAIAGGIHTVNESINVESFVEMIGFYITLILNADESTAL